MPVKKGRKNKNNKPKKHKALNSKLAGFIIIILIITAGMFYYVKYMPQVSDRAADEALAEYHEALKRLYPVLNENYTLLKQAEDEEKWDEFSREWMAEYREARPEILDRRLTRKSEERKQVLISAQRDLLMLWHEYHSSIKGGYINEEHVGDLKRAIEECLENFR